MIFRAQVAVLLAVPENWGSVPEPEKTLWEAVAYTLGINARGASDAIGLAVTAAQNAVGRDGEYIGGVVVEAHCRCAGPKEFDGYEKYFHAPVVEPGIFYVSGVTSYAIAEELTKAVHVELEAMRSNIRRSGLPAPSFVHPKLPDEPPKKIRLLCDVCGRWVEVNSLGLMYSFLDTLHGHFPEEREAWRAKDVAGPFVRRHISECGGCITGIHEDDERWNELSPANREDDGVL